MKPILIIALIIALTCILGHSQESQTNSSSVKESANNPPGADEGSAWNATVKKGTKEAYLAFAREHPKADRVQVRTGTVRGRYWYKMAMPFAQKAEKAECGVLVTVEGLNVLRNVSLKEARGDKLLDIKPATKGEQAKAGGQTFNWTCLEVTRGGCVVDDELIAPRDTTNAMVILSSDGKDLLAWDVGDAKVAAEPTDKPTYIDLPSNQAWLPKP